MSEPLWRHLLSGSRRTKPSGSSPSSVLWIVSPTSLIVGVPGSWPRTSHLAPHGPVVHLVRSVLTLMLVVLSLVPLPTVVVMSVSGLVMMTFPILRLLLLLSLILLIEISFLEMMFGHVTARIGGSCVTWRLVLRSLTGSRSPTLHQSGFELCRQGIGIKGSIIESQFRSSFPGRSGLLGRVLR